MSRYVEYLKSLGRSGNVRRASVTPGVSGGARFSSELMSIDQELNALIMSISPGSPLRDAALRKAANVVVAEMRTHITDYDKPVKRYRNGKVVATYYPGNLRRAIGVLDLRNTTSVFAGVLVRPRGKSGGNFRGKKVDGYYARFIEAKNPFIRPSFDAKAGEMKTIIRDGLLKALTG